MLYDRVSALAAEQTVSAMAAEQTKDDVTNDAG